jgi:hypothetical protein
MITEPVHTHTRSTDRCSDCVPDAGKQIDDLRKETTEQSRIMERVEIAVTKISETLIGTYDKQGMIGRVDAQIERLANKIRDLEEWKDGVEVMKKNIIGKIVVIGGAAILFVFGAAWVILKSTAGM